MRSSRSDTNSPLRTRTVAQVISQNLVQERVTAMLASLGFYGLMSSGVARRTRETGIRAALGAQQGSVLWIVLREALVLSLLGIAIGIPAALGRPGSSRACSSAFRQAICRLSRASPCCFFLWRCLQVIYRPGALQA